MDTSAHASLPLPLVKQFLIQALKRSSRSLRPGTSILSHEWADWGQALGSWRQALASMDDPSRRLLLADRDVWEAAIEAAPHPQGVARCKHDGKDAYEWKRIPEELEKEQAQWVHEGLIPQQTPSSVQWPALSLVRQARQHGIEWEDVAERFSLAFANSMDQVCDALLEAYPDLDVEAALAQEAHGWKQGDRSHPRPLYSLLFSEPLWEASQVLQAHEALTAEHVRRIQERDPALLHGTSTDLEQARALLKLGADPDKVSADGVLADETKSFNTKNALAFHELLQSYRSTKKAHEARKRVMATAFTNTPTSVMLEVGFLPEIAEDPHVPTEEGEMTLLSFLHHRFESSRFGRLGNLIQILSGKRRARRVLDAEGSREKGLAQFMGLLAQDPNAPKRVDALRKIFKAQLEGADANRTLALAFQMHGQRTATPDAMDTILQAMGDSPTERLFLEGMDYATWDAFRKGFSHFLSNSKWVPPNGLTSQQWGREKVWARVSTALLDVLEIHDKRGQISDAQKSDWLPCMMGLASGIREKDHPAYLKIMEWMHAGIDPAWPSAEVETRVERWMRTRYPQYDVNVVASRMENQIPAAPAVRRNAPKRF